MDPLIIVAIIGAIGSIVTTIISGIIAIKVNSTHKLVNSRMTEMLVITRKAYTAEGHIAGVAEERANISGQSP